ncbi:hypothetical protein [Azospirillum sp. TSO35-2]|uniref:hypothetical protein n=1 Tax=Azospirillum sp. TSO35-2 TaxID=716796 RepID=UPI0013048A19|nr:hypothetical protein [Azospirillum sp. TSO35-2]
MDLIITSVPITGVPDTVYRTCRDRLLMQVKAVALSPSPEGWMMQTGAKSQCVP